MTVLKVFSNAKVTPHGWYWALPSKELAPTQKRELNLFGNTILIYRSKEGVVHAVEAYCPHMGAHLSAGVVEKGGLRCGFHGWKFGPDGTLLDTPCKKQSTASKIRALVTYRVSEKFGMIWIHTDASSKDPLPDFPALDGQDVSVFVDRPERRGCHPTLILGGGVDEEHFLYVHHKTTSASGPLAFNYERILPSVIKFWNHAPIASSTWKGRFLRAIYGNVLRYEVTYWNASTALAALGPPWLPLYSIFAYRPTPEGGTEGLNIYVTPRRRGLGWLVSLFALAVTRLILRGGGKEDAVIQNRIRFSVGPETLANPPFAAFVAYVEEQPVLQLK